MVTLNKTKNNVEETKFCSWPQKLPATWDFILKAFETNRKWNEKFERAQS